MKQQDLTFWNLRLCAFQNPDTERITVGCKHRATPGAAMTGNGAILLSSHSPSVIRVFRHGSRRRQWGQPFVENLPGVEIPVELIRCQPSDDFPTENRGVEDK